jgi:AbrB family looped-hinge helix DNA binding protein
MPSATLTSKGQITLPVQMRTKLGLVPGSKVEFEEQPNGDYVVRRRTIDVRDLRGMLKPPAGVTATVEEMRKAIEDEAAARFDRTR